MRKSGGVLLPHGGYEKLRAYAVAKAVYDATVVFCDRFIDKRSRTHDQMVQAARSGVQTEASLSRGLLPSEGHAHVSGNHELELIARPSAG